MPPKPVIAIPDAPEVASCPAKPLVEGTVSKDGKYVVLDVAMAKKLAIWIHDYQVCMEANAVTYEGYIKKLINRLQALGGK